MSLSSAINTAQSIFSNTGLQTAALSKNIANASNADYSRRVGVLTVTASGNQELFIQRTQSDGLLRLNLNSVSKAEAQTTLQEKLETIKSFLGGNDYETSPSTYIAELRDQLQAYATKPGEETLASGVVSTAIDAANSLNSVSNSIQNLRGDIDQEIDLQVNELRQLLDQFEVVNNKIKSGTQLERDVNNELDVRDGLLKQISSIIGVNAITRPNNDMMLYTSDGITLFETSPRTIRFETQPIYSAGTTGNQLTIDGVPIDRGQDGNTTAKGSLAALLQIRDNVIPTYQSQLDEIARGLITMFAEHDQSGGGLDDQPGLFSWQGFTAGDPIPPASTVVPGLANIIVVNPAVVKSLGGSPTLLRDGGINGAAYVANSAGNAGFSDLLDEYVKQYDIEQTFDTNASIDATATIGSYSTASVGWLEQLVRESKNAKETKDANLTRSTEALSNKTGVNLDEELALLLDLEQSYKASTKIVMAVDEMLQSLLAMAR